MRVVDHKSVSAQAKKSTAPSSNDNNTPFSIHNYNEHITPSAFVPYPKQNQLASEKSTSTETAAEQSDTKNGEQSHPVDNSQDAASASQHKQPPPKPRVFTTVLHPTPRSLQAELTLLATTPDPRAAKQAAATASRPQGSSATVPPSPGASTQPERGHVAKRQKMLVEPDELHECESKLTRALAPPLFLEPVDSLEGVHKLLKHLESPLHRDVPPSPKRRKRTVAELAADEALAAEEERFMLIMDARLEPTTSGAAGATKSAAVDDTGGAFEPTFSRFKKLESIRIQHEEKMRRDNENKVKQDMIKRQQQDQERERRRISEQRQAEEQAKEESRRQQLAAQQAQAQLAAQQQQQGRQAMAQPNGVSQASQASPVVRNHTPLNASSPIVGSTMGAQASVPMAMSSSMQGAGSPQRPPSALQHAHPNMMGHPMVPSRSQQGPSRHGTPQMTQGTPAMSQATPVMRNATPTQRMSHTSPPRSSMAPTPVMNQAMMATPQMAGQMGLNPQQQQQLLMQRQQLLQQGQHVNHSQLTPQQFAQLQANMVAQNNIQNHQQQMMHQQQQPTPQSQQQKFANPQAYQAGLLRAQYAQMQMVQQQSQHRQQHQHPHQQPQPQPQPQPQGQQPQPQQGQMMQNSPQINAQQQQMLMAAAQANGNQPMQNMQPRMSAHHRYSQIYNQRLQRLRQEMSNRLMPQYGPPGQYPPQIAQEYGAGLEQAAKGFVHEVMRRDRDVVAAQQQRQAQAAAQAQAMQQQNMLQNGMGK